MIEVRAIGVALAASVILATGAAAQDLVENRRAKHVCMQHLLTQAANAGYDVVAEEITLTPQIAESANSMRVNFEVDAPGVVASGNCLVVGNRSNAYVKDVELSFAER